MWKSGKASQPSSIENLILENLPYIYVGQVSKSPNFELNQMSNVQIVSSIEELVDYLIEAGYMEQCKTLTLALQGSPSAQSEVANAVSLTYLFDDILDKGGERFQAIGLLNPELPPQIIKAYVVVERLHQFAPSPAYDEFLRQLGQTRLPKLRLNSDEAFVN